MVLSEVLVLFTVVEGRTRSSDVLLPHPNDHGLGMAASAAATRSPERMMQRVVATTPLGDATNRRMTSSSSTYTIQ